MKYFHTFRINRNCRISNMAGERHDALLQKLNANKGPEDVELIAGVSCETRRPVTEFDLTRSSSGDLNNQPVQMQLHRHFLKSMPYLAVHFIDVNHDSRCSINQSATT